MYNMHPPNFESFWRQKMRIIFGNVVFCIPRQKELQDVQNLQSLQAQNSVKKYFETEGLFDTQMSKEQEVRF